MELYQRKLHVLIHGVTFGLHKMPKRAKGWGLLKNSIPFSFSWGF